VVIQEAVAAGRIVICSDACGAGVHLVHDGLSGYVVQTGNVEQLARRMADLTALSSIERRRMVVAGHDLSKQYTPERWAATLMRVIGDNNRQAP